MRKGAARVALAVSLSRVAGLIRERIFAQYLGTSDAADAYGAAFRIPTLLESLLGERIFSSAFIPKYSRLLAEGSGAEATRLARAVAAIHALVVTVIVAAGVTLAPILVPLIAQGFDPSKTELTIRLVRVLFPAVGLLVLGGWCLGVLNSHRRFFLPYIVPVLSSVSISVALIRTGSGRDPADLAAAAAWGALAGAALQLLFQLPSVLRAMEPAGPRRTDSGIHIRDVGRNALPAAGRGLVSRLGTWVEVGIAGFVSTGALAGLNYAQLLYSLPVGLFTVAVSAAMLPELSAVTADREHVAERLTRQLDSAMRHTAYLLVGSAAVFMALGDVLVAAVYQGGQFSASDVTWVWAILGASSIGLVGASMGGLQATAFYALGDARTPLKASLVRLAARAVLGVVLAIPVVRALGIDPRWGAAGLGAAIGISGWIEFVLLRGWLERRLGRPRTPGLVPYLVRLWSIAAAAAAVGWVAKLTIPFTDPIARAALILGAFSLVYTGTTLALGMQEPRNFLHQLRELLTAQR